MSQKEGKKLSQKAVKRNFTTIGLILIFYIFLVMFVPYLVHYYIEEIDTAIANDEFLYYGIYFILMVVGTIIPFFIMRKFSKIKMKKLTRKVDATFVDLFVQTIVFFTICIALTYVSNMLISYIGLEGKLISSIGYSYEDANLKNILYVFMLIFVSPLLEEYAFRGVLLNSLSRYGKSFALYATSIIFALAHNNFAEMIPAFAMGVALGKTSLRYKSIQPTIIIHILFNAFIYGLFVMPVSIAKYMAYALVAICVLAFALILTGRYEKISIQVSKTNAIASRLFYSRFTIIFAMILMIAYTCLFTFIY